MTSKKNLAKVLILLVLLNLALASAQESRTVEKSANDSKTSVEPQKTTPTTIPALGATPTTTTTTTTQPANEVKKEEPPEYIEYPYPEYLEVEKKIDKIEIENAGYFGHKSEAEEAEERYLAYTKKIYKKLNVWVSYGMGVPLEKFKMFSTQYIFGADLRLSGDLWGGFFFKNVTAKTVQSVHFNDTGYNEDRTYKITSIIFGPHFTYHLKGKYHLAGGLGISITESQLEAVSTDAPLPSSLEVGKKKAAPVDIGYHLAVRYEFKLKTNYSWGVDAGYSSSMTSNQEGAIKEIYTGLYFKYFSFPHSKHNDGSQAKESNPEITPHGEPSVPKP